MRDAFVAPSPRSRDDLVGNHPGMARVRTLEHRRAQRVRAAGRRAVSRALEQRLREERLRGPVRIVQSNGGTTSLRAARATPIRLVESGPAAGVIGAARLGERLGEPNVLYLDIGGTTAKCSLIEDGEPKTTTEYRIEWRPDYAGYPIMVPVVDIVEIGAGGGSIAWVDDGGSVCVGPRSAGAEPGPACYGRGGRVRP